MLRTAFFAFLLGRLGPLVDEAAPTGGVAELGVARAPRILVPAGRFRVGSLPEDIARVELLCIREGGSERSCSGELFLVETPDHEVSVPAFRIDRTEVTVAAYGRCVQAGMCASPLAFAGDTRFDGPAQPVVGVSWDDAAQYCAWTGGRLPTEVEWERAARGAAARTFPWGETWNPSLSNHGKFDVTGGFSPDDRDGFRYTAPVGSFPDGASPYGVLDLAGNVAEWVEDFFEDYDEPRPPVTPRIYRVLRGGAWTAPAPYQRGAARTGALPNYQGMDVGFRCAADLPR